MRIKKLLPLVFYSVTFTCFAQNSDYTPNYSVDDEHLACLSPIAGEEIDSIENSVFFLFDSFWPQKLFSSASFYSNGSNYYMLRATLRNGTQDSKLISADRFYGMRDKVETIYQQLSDDEKRKLAKRRSESEFVPCKVEIHKYYN